ncbi:hypothetical protein AVEN_254438-1 [Araneus ventricosus]|uniref:Uncharacterized protein n=1 Tax=Araneus ventricosus TaxID=182803 RepID=A0A4Y2GK85_ARAVE|nr:hypothetical protein AVEN_254438-1 [Araneus ventricosus]
MPLENEDNVEPKCANFDDPRAASHQGCPIHETEQQNLARKDSMPHLSKKTSKVENFEIEATLSTEREREDQPPPKEKILIEKQENIDEIAGLMKLPNEQRKIFVSTERLREILKKEFPVSF